MIWPAFYGVLVAMAIVFATVAETRSAWNNLVGGALVLAGSWTASNALTFTDYRLRASCFPIMDVGLAAFFAMQWFSNRKLWSIGVSVLLLYECAVHMMFKYSGFHDYASKYEYDFTLNIVFALQLSCVMFASVHRILSEGQRGPASE